MSFHQKVEVVAADFSAKTPYQWCFVGHFLPSSLFFIICELGSGCI